MNNERKKDRDEGSREDEEKRVKEKNDTDNE